MNLPTQRTLHKTLLATLLAGLAFGALSQPAPGNTANSPSSAAAPAPTTTVGAPLGPRTRMQQHVQQRLARLKAQLKLTADQEGAWSTYTQAMTPPPHPGDPKGHEELAQLSTPERLDRMKQMRQQHEAFWDQRDQATRTFYSALSDEQKKIFDRETLPHGRMEHRGPMNQGGEPGAPR